MGARRAIKLGGIMSTNAKSFTDSTDRVWTPRVTIETLERFEQETGVGLLHEVYEVLTNSPGKKLAMDKVSVLRALNDIFQGKLSNLITLGWCACERQAKVVNVSRAEFVQSIGGAQVRPMMLAIVGAYADFFQAALGIDLSAMTNAAAPGQTATSTK